MLSPLDKFKLYSGGQELVQYWLEHCEHVIIDGKLVVPYLVWYVSFGGRAGGEYPSLDDVKAYLKWCYDNDYTAKHSHYTFNATETKRAIWQDLYDWSHGITRLWEIP